MTRRGFSNFLFLLGHEKYCKYPKEARNCSITPLNIISYIFQLLLSLKFKFYKCKFFDYFEFSSMQLF